MPEVSEHKPGAFCWTDLSTPDPEKAKAFYAGLFGWTYVDRPIDEEGGAYTLIHKNGKQVAGLAKSWDATVPPNWSTYVCVADADATAQAITDAGGKIVAAPMDVLNSLGRMFVAADPEGAVFCGWQPGDHKGAQLIGEPGAMMWWEAYLRDVEQGKAFYHKVFGWTTRPQPVPGTEYFVWKNGEDEVGGMLKIMPDMGDMPAAWLVTFAVDDVDGAHAKVKELGGEPITPCMDAPGMGRFAWVKDPFGAVFILFQLTKA